MTAPLRFEDVTFAYPGTPVFSGLDLAVPEGGIVAILGPNGSGKTTLVRLATAVARPQRGRVLLYGEPVHGLGAREVARRVAVVPQEEASVFSYRVDEVVLMGRTPWASGFGFDSARDREIAGKSLEAVHAAHLADRDLDEISGGERQRVLVARALAQEARLLVLDEPTSHLDLKHRVEMFRLLRRLCDTEGLTIVVISHDVNLAARFSDRLVLLAGGRVAAEGPPDEVLDSEILSEVYGTAVRVSRLSGDGPPIVFPE